MNYLFVCTANKDRSRTAEIYFQWHYPHHTFRSAGINKYLSERHGGIHVSEYMCNSADVIFCMEKIHSAYLLDKIGIHLKDKIKVVNLGDTEKFMSSSLIQVIKEKIKIDE